LFNAKISGASDLEFVNFDKTLYLGTRLSAEHYSKQNPNGEIYYDSPFTYLDAKSKIKISTPHVELNLSFGASYHSTHIS
jgi:hypothetical protein